MLCLSTKGFSLINLNYQLKTNDCKRKIKDEEFIDLIGYVINYLETNIENLSFKKNVSGFIRISIPPPEILANQVKELRLNYWLPEIPISPESTHSHPLYFESLVINGCYEHEIFNFDVETSNKLQTLKMFRIHKQNNNNIHYEYIGETNLYSQGIKTVRAGFVAGFPKSLIHRILSAQPYSLTLNVVFNSESNEIYFDIFKPDNFLELELNLENEFLENSDSYKHVYEILNNLRKFLDNY